MTKYFYYIYNKSYLKFIHHFDKYPYLFDNYKFLELTLSMKTITDILMQNDVFKSKARRAIAYIIFFHICAIRFH